MRGCSLIITGIAFFYLSDWTWSREITIGPCILVLEGEGDCPDTNYIKTYLFTSSWVALLGTYCWTLFILQLLSPWFQVSELLFHQESYTEMERWIGRVAVVTGASAGMGSAICKDLVEQGMVVVGLARREDRLKELKDQLKDKTGALHFVKTDISKEDEVKSAFKWIKEKLGGVDVLINNAGNNVRGMVNELQKEDWQRVFDVNVFAVAMCSREAVSSMKERNVDGHIVIINSIASFKKPNPNGCVYASSKHASKAISEGLRRDLIAQKSKIKVTSLSPGLVESELFSSSNIQLDFSTLPHLQPQDIAEAVRYVLSTPPHVLINELTVRSVSDDL